jgi:hypothetical protein
MTPPENVGFDEAPSASQAPAIIHLPHLPPPAKPIPAEPRTPRRGRHFGPRPVADPRSARLDIRCTPVVRAKAEAAAAAAGISVAGYVAMLIGGQPGPRVHRNPNEATKLLAQLRGEMGKRGSNLNQGRNVALFANGAENIGPVGRQMAIRRPTTALRRVIAIQTPPVIELFFSCFCHQLRRRME